MSHPTPDPVYNVPGLFLGSPREGLEPPSPLLTHWVGFDGGFNAWATPVSGEYLLLCSAEEGDPFDATDEDGHPLQSQWELGVIRLEDAEVAHESEASPVNLQSAIEQLVMMNWRERDELD